jgi:hypothetical protein
MDFLVNILWFCVWVGLIAFLIYWSNKRRSENKVNIDNLKLSETGGVVAKKETTIESAKKIVKQNGSCMNINCRLCFLEGADHFEIGDYKEAAIKFLEENEVYQVDNTILIPPNKRWSK